MWLFSLVVRPSSKCLWNLMNKFLSNPAEQVDRQTCQLWWLRLFLKMEEFWVYSCPWPCQQCLLLVLRFLILCFWKFFCDKSRVSVSHIMTTRTTTYSTALYPRQPWWDRTSRTFHSLTAYILEYYTVSLINFIHLLQSIASSLIPLWRRLCKFIVVCLSVCLYLLQSIVTLFQMSQVFSTTSVQDVYVYVLHLLLHSPCIFSLSHSHPFLKHPYHLTLFCCNNS